jgi:hypothetical protein
MQPTLINVVLDKSGSMGHLQRATIEGFNQFLWDQQRQDGECRLSLTQFDTSMKVDYVATDIHAVQPLGTWSYQPNGGTALLDAVGITIKGAEQWLLKHPGNWKSLVVIFTDGEENSSHEWHLNQPMIPGDQFDIGGLIQWKQNEGWEFLFMGTGGSAWLERTFGSFVAHDHFVGYAATADAHAHSYAGLSTTTSTLRSTGNLDTSHLHDQGASTSSGS